MTAPSTPAPATVAPNLRQFRWPRTVLLRFTARRNMKTTVLWTAVFVIFTLANLMAYASVYPSEASRLQLATSFGSNVGLKVLLGEPLHIESPVGFTDWRGLGTIIWIAAIWGCMWGARVFRGEENAGRWELFLAGHTTARRAAGQALAGIGGNLLILFLVISTVLLTVGRAKDDAVTVTGSLSYALVVALVVGLFVAVSALVSQIVSTKGRALSISAGVFGVCFLLRGVADSVPAAHWLINFTPFGWLEKVHPLSATNTVWFLPVIGLLAILVGTTVFLAGQRDLGTGLVTDRDTARPRLGLLKSPLGLGLRLTRAATLAWVFGLSAVGLLMGSLAQSAGETLGSSTAAQQVIERVTAATQFAGAITYVGMAFFIILTLIALFAASSAAAIRTEESDGYLDNLLVQPVSRVRWLSGRLFLAAVGIMLAASLSGAAIWGITSLQNLGISSQTIFEASVTAMAPALLVLGVGTLAFGFVPRLTSVIVFGVVAWSFLVQMIGSLLNLNHWILDTSLLHHIPLVPAVPPNWSAVGAFALLGLLAAGLGMWRFHRRDLANE